MLMFEYVYDVFTVEIISSRRLVDVYARVAEFVEKYFFEENFCIVDLVMVKVFYDYYKVKFLCVWLYFVVKCLFDRGIIFIFVALGVGFDCAF